MAFTKYITASKYLPGSPESNGVPPESRESNIALPAQYTRYLSIALSESQAFAFEHPGSQIQPESFTQRPFADHMFSGGPQSFTPQK